MIGIGMIIEGFDAPVMPPGHLVDRPQYHRLQRADPVHGHDRAADAAAAVMSFQSALAPAVRCPKKIDDPIDLANPVVQTQTDTIKRHDPPSEPANVPKP